MSAGERVVVRTANAGDLGPVLALWKHERSSAATTPDTIEGLTALLETDSEALLVAELDGEIAGSVIAAWDGWRGTMYRLAVASQRRRQGVGTSLVEAGHERLRSLGALKVTLMSGHEDDLAADFWVSRGYRRDDDVQRFVRTLA